MVNKQNVTYLKYIVGCPLRCFTNIPAKEAPISSSFPDSSWNQINVTSTVKIINKCEDKTVHGLTCMSHNSWVSKCNATKTYYLFLRHRIHHFQLCIKNFYCISSIYI